MRILIACLLLSCVAFAGAPLSEPYTREVKVPAAGWYRVPVDGHIWRYARGRVLAFDEQGKALPCSILPVEVPSPVSEEAQPRLVKIEEEGNDLVLYMQVDRLAGKHDRLTLDFGGSDLLEQVALWGSWDGHEWKAIAQGTLFRLGSEERMQGTALDYPVSGFDHLKLSLPLIGEIKQAIRDFRVGSIRLHYSSKFVKSPWIDEPVPVHRVDPDLARSLVGESEILLQIGLPKGLFLARQIHLPLASSHLPCPVALLKLFMVPEWEYSCMLDTDIQSFPTPKGRLIAPAYIKLPKDLADITEIFVSRPQEEAVFFTDHAGFVTLAYGGIEERPSTFPTISRPAISAEIEPGPMIERPLSISPEIVALARQLSPPAIQAAWDLKLPAGTEPGQWAMVEINPEIVDSVHSASEGDWSIISNGELVPWIWLFHPVPVLYKKQSIEMQTDKSRSSGEYVVHGTMTLNHQILLSSWISARIERFPEPLSLHVEARKSFAWKGGRRSNNPPTTWDTMGWVTLASGPWSREAIGLVSTEVIPNRYQGILRFTARSANLMPPNSLEVAAWRQRHFIAFPAPGSQSVQLVFGSIHTQQYLTVRKHFMEKLLLFIDLPQAKLGVRADTSAGAKRPWDRILFIAGLILAVAVLLYLIVKLLPKKETA